ncbi:MAG: hypothetical protein ACRDV4_11820 [Acidimicrobiales bacterium]
MTSLRYEHRHLDVACALNVSDASARVVEWQELRDRYGMGVERIPGGARLWLRLDAEVLNDSLDRDPRRSGRRWLPGCVLGASRSRTVHEAALKVMLGR